MHFWSYLILVQRLGCFKDTGRRAIPQLDGRSRFLRGNYQRRRYAIQKCSLEAAKRGYSVFGVQNGGWCASGPQAHRTFAKYGRSNRCRNGKGGPWANDVYRITGLEMCFLKCFDKCFVQFIGVLMTQLHFVTQIARQMQKAYDARKLLYVPVQVSQARIQRLRQK